MERQKYTYDYPRPAVATDTVLFGIEDGVLKVLLVKRGFEAFVGTFALPGGFMNPGEDAQKCALRELKEETGLVPAFIRQFRSYTNPKRDVRGWYFSIAHIALGDISGMGKPVGGDDATDALWMPLQDIIEDDFELAFDHKAIVKDAYNELRGLLRTQPIAIYMLPYYLRMKDLLAVYQSVLIDCISESERKFLLERLLSKRKGRSMPVSYRIIFEKGNFQKKMLAMFSDINESLFQSVGRESSVNANPSILYKVDKALLSRCIDNPDSGFYFDSKPAIEEINDYKEIL